MASWRRWCATGVICFGLCGCGGSESKPPDGAAGGGPPVIAPPVIAAPKPALPAAFVPKSGVMQELLQFAPENLMMAAGLNVALLSEKPHPVGTRLLAQFQPVFATLARAGVRIEQIDRLWGGINRERGDLVVCVRTKGSYDLAAVMTGFGASGTGDRVGKAAIYSLPAHPALKNVVAFIDPRTFLLGRHATVTAGLSNPKPGPVRLGHDALNQPDAYYWIAGDESCLGPWFRSGGVAELEQLAADSLRLRGIGIGFGGNEPLPAPAETESASQVVDLSLGLGFASEALAMAIENRLSQRQKLPEKGTPANSDTSGLPEKSGFGETAYRFQRRADDSDDDRRGGRQKRMGVLPKAAGESGPTDSALKVERAKENLRVSLSIVARAPLINRLISDALPASGVSAVSDGLLDGTLMTLAAGLAQWQSARPDTLKGVRRIGELRLALGYSWMTELLPFIGQDELYLQFDLTKSWSAPGNHPLTMTVVPAFLNPADPRVTWNGYPDYLNGMGLTHFVGMSGVEEGRNDVAAELPRSDPHAGIFGYDEMARMGDVTDGTGQTIMVIGSGAVTAPWVQAGGATIRGARAPYFHKFSGFGSQGLASAGAFVLFADGSAKSISATIDPEVFKALCTMHGAEQVDLSKLSPGNPD
jgi:hypothetical protein